MIQQESMDNGRRVVTISVLDVDGDPAGGAELTFAVHGVHYGTATVGDGSVRLEFPAHGQTVDVMAEYGSEVQHSHLSAYENYLTFRFRWRSGRSLSGGTARCPDGTVGQPCVDCVVNGVRVRICA